MAYAMPKKKAPQKVAGKRPTPKAQMTKMPMQTMQQGGMSNHETMRPPKARKAK